MLFRCGGTTIHMGSWVFMYDGQNGRRKNNRFELKFYEFIEQTKKRERETKIQK